MYSYTTSSDKRHALPVPPLNFAGGIAVGQVSKTDISVALPIPDQADNIYSPRPSILGH